MSAYSSAPVDHAGAGSRHEITPRSIETASQDAAWRILKACDMLRAKLDAFETRNDEQQRRIDRLEEALAGEHQKRSAFESLAATVRQAFEGMRHELAGVSARLDKLETARPEQGGEALRLLMQEMLEAPFTVLGTRLASIDRQLGEAKAVPAIAPAPEFPSLEDEKRALQRQVTGLGLLFDRFGSAIERIETVGSEAGNRFSGQVAAVGGKVDDFIAELRTSRLANLPDIADAFRNQPAMQQPDPSAQEDRAAFQRLIAAFGHLLSRFSAGLDTFEALGADVGLRLSTLVERIDHKVEDFVEELRASRLASLPDVADALRRKAHLLGDVEKQQFGQIMLGLRMVADQLAHNANRITDRKGNPAEADLAKERALVAGTLAGLQTIAGQFSSQAERIEALLGQASAPSPAIAVDGDAGGAALAVAELVAAAEMRLDAAARSLADQAAVEMRKLEATLAMRDAGAPLASPAQDPLPALMQRLADEGAAAATRLERARDAIAAFVPRLTEGGEIAPNLVETLRQATGDLDGRAGEFLSLSAALSHELGARGASPARQTKSDDRRPFRRNRTTKFTSV
jgi:hypothetical protein